MNALGQMITHQSKLIALHLVTMTDGHTEDTSVHSCKLKCHVSDSRLKSPLNLNREKSAGGRPVMQHICWPSESRSQCRAIITSSVNTFQVTPLKVASSDVLLKNRGKAQVHKYRVFIPVVTDARIPEAVNLDSEGHCGFHSASRVASRSLSSSRHISK